MLRVPVTVTRTAARGLRRPSPDPGAVYIERMRRMVSRVGAWLELARPEVLAAVTADVSVMIVLGFAAGGPALTRELAGLGVWLSLGVGVVLAGSLVGCGAALHDALDARHDRAFAPERPIPSKRLPRRAAASGAVLALAGAVLASLPLGPPSTVLTLLTACGIVFYNGAGRFLPAVGVVSLGLLHGAAMAVPRVPLAEPVLVVMTHAMVCETLRHWRADKRPRLRGMDAAGIVAGWAFWCGLVVWFARWRGGEVDVPWEAWSAAAWVGGAAAGFIVTGVIAWGRGASQFERVAMLWPTVYAAAWLAAAGRWEWVWLPLACGAAALAVRAAAWAWRVWETPRRYTLPSRA